MKITKEQVFIVAVLGLVTYFVLSPISKKNKKTSKNIIINPTEIDCHNCNWKWPVKQGGNDLFICHKCYYDNSKFYRFTDLNS